MAVLSLIYSYRNVASIDIPMRAIQCVDIVLKVNLLKLFYLI